MERTKMMDKYKAITGKQPTYWTAFGEEYFPDFLNWLYEGRELYDEMRQTPNLPDDYAIFLVYFARNKGDFHKTVHVLTDEGRCSLECMEWFAMMLGISWEPDWR